MVVDVIPSPDINEIPAPEHSEEELQELAKKNFGKFRKVAKEQYGVKDAFKMKMQPIMDAIKDALNMNIKDETEPKEEEAIVN